MADSIQGLFDEFISNVKAQANNYVTTLNNQQHASYDGLYANYLRNLEQVPAGGVKPTPPAPVSVYDIDIDDLIHSEVSNFLDNGHTNEVNLHDYLKITGTYGPTKPVVIVPPPSNVLGKKIATDTWAVLPGDDTLDGNTVTTPDGKIAVKGHLGGLTNVSIYLVLGSSPFTNLYLNSLPV